MPARQPLPPSRAYNLPAAGPLEDSRYPALAFARANGLRGIGQRYVIPNGLSAVELEDRIWARTFGLWPRATTWNPNGRHKTSVPTHTPFHLRQLWQQMKDLNPALHKLRVRANTTDAVLTALTGVTSGFNLNDIQYYLNLEQRGWAPAYHSLRHPLHGPRIRQIDKVAAVPSQWVMSPATISLIEKKFVRKGLLAKP